MGPIPLQRDIVQRPGIVVAGQGDDPWPVARTSLPGIPQASAAARRFVRAALADWTGLGLPTTGEFGERLTDDALTVASELVTNAVVHAGTTVELLLRLEDSAGPEPAALVLEITDHHPARSVRDDRPERPDPAEYGRGSSSSPPSPSPGASPTAPASRPSGRASPATTATGCPTPRPPTAPPGAAARAPAAS